MAHHKSAIKRIKTSKKAQERNRHYKSILKTVLKSVFETGDKENIAANAKKAESVLDRLVVKGIIHRNKAANQKSRIAKYVASI